MKKLVVCLSILLGSTSLIGLPGKSGIGVRMEWPQDKVEIEREDLPLAVSKAMTKNDYDQWEVSRVFQVRESVNSFYYLFYSIEFDTGHGKMVTVNFDEEGNLL